MILLLVLNRMASINFNILEKKKFNNKIPTEKDKFGYLILQLFRL